MAAQLALLVAMAFEMREVLVLPIAGFLTAVHQPDCV
jgi:hypothetical protein